MNMAPLLFLLLLLHLPVLLALCSCLPLRYYAMTSTPCTHCFQLRTISTMRLIHALMILTLELHGLLNHVALPNALLDVSVLLFTMCSLVTRFIMAHIDV
jgi:hypothetical protein